MSFTSTVKNEVSDVKLSGASNVSLLSAIVKTIGLISEDKIILTTENLSVANMTYNLLVNLYDINAKIIVRNGYNFNKNYVYILEITSRINFILNDLSIIDDYKVLDYPKDYITADSDLVRAYLAGVFLGIGSVNDPKKSRYHLEFLVDTLEYAEFLNNKLNKFLLNSKIIKRETKYMIYIKEAEKISDFLRLIQSSKAVLYFENIRIYRESANMANRLNNCEQANVDKTIETANSLVNDYNLLESLGVSNLLDEKVIEVAKYRCKYPEASLIELSEIITMETGTKITKSGLYHRLTKIKDLASKLRVKIKKQTE